MFENHSDCLSTQIEEDIFVPRLLCNNVIMEYGKEYLLLGYIREDNSEANPPIAALYYIFEWGISQEEETERRIQYGLLPQSESKYVIRDQIMEKYVN